MIYVLSSASLHYTIVLPEQCQEKQYVPSKYFKVLFWFPVCDPYPDRLCTAANIPSWYCLNLQSDPQPITHMSIPQIPCKYSEQPVTFRILIRNQYLLKTHTHTFKDH